MKGPNWKSDVVAFAQHMKEEDEVIINWQQGKHETGQMICDACGDRNAWNRSHNWYEQ